MENGLPAPSAALAIIGAALLEHELDCPGFIERVRARVESEQLRTAIVRLRGPRMSAEVLEALDTANAWMGAACLVADAVKPKKKRRA